MKDLSAPAGLVEMHAITAAKKDGLKFPTPEHLLYTILNLENLPQLPIEPLVLPELLAMEQAFEDADLIIPIVRDYLFGCMEKEVTKENYRVRQVDAQYREILGLADRLAKGDKITCLDLLAAILKNPTPLIRHAIETFNILPESLGMYCLIHPPVPVTKKESPAISSGELADDDKFLKDYVVRKGATLLLDRFGKDLTDYARSNKLHPLIGRRDVLLQLIQTLGREGKNNPILVGEAGVGKTAIVEGLAIRIAEGKDPQVLQGKRLIQINVSALLAGTEYRGQFELKLEKMIAEARLNPEIILFIDELHSIIGAGRSDGGGTDAANVLKPALSRGDIRIIGATTFEEYNRYIETDEAFSRRFEKITVGEPGTSETLEILRGVRPSLEKHHGIPITDTALRAAVDLSVKFDKNHHLPDKAIDLIDKAAVKVRVPVLSGSVRGEGQVTDTIIAEVLAEKTGIPLSLITGFCEDTQQAKILGLEQHLRTRVVGQDAAVDILCKRLKIAYAGLMPRERPVGVFLFMGPSGVGKTEMAKATAEYLFGTESALIRFDMSEFMDKESVSRLIGSPPGYIGFEYGGKLINTIRDNPFCVILFDEIEKAHPLVFDIFLQLFGEGRITDSRGRTADATNTIIIMTSNMRANPLLLSSSSQPGNLTATGITDKNSAQDGGSVHSAAPLFFRTEFLNRIDEIVLFHDLSQKDLTKILEQILDEMTERVTRNQNIQLLIDKEVYRFLLVSGCSEEFGVRELQRITERYIYAPLSDMILKGTLRNSPVWQIVYVNGQIVIKPGTDETKQK